MSHSPTLAALHTGLNKLLTFAADPTETLGVHTNRLVADSVQLRKDIADDWASTRQEFDALRRWSPQPNTSG